MKLDKYVCWKEGKEPQIIESDCCDEALREYDFKEMDSKEYYHNIKDITKHYQCHKLKRDVEELTFNSFSWFEPFTYGEKGNTQRGGLIVSVDDEFVEFFGGGDWFTLTKEQFLELYNKTGNIQFRREKNNK